MMCGSGRESGAHQQMLEAGMVHVIKKWSTIIPSIYILV